mgnify:CR=1 FL=1
MKFFYNKQFHRLEIYFDKKTSVDGHYWDNVWVENKKIFKNLYKNKTYVSNITKKYLKNQSKILEAGCGLGQHVFALKENNLIFSKKKGFNTLNEELMELYNSKKFTRMVDDK